MSDFGEGTIKRMCIEGVRSEFRNTVFPAKRVEIHLAVHPRKNVIRKTFREIVNRGPRWSRHEKRYRVIGQINVFTAAFHFGNVKDRESVRTFFASRPIAEVFTDR